MKTRITFIVILLLFILLGLIAIRKRRQEIARIPMPESYPIPVEWTTLKSGNLTSTFSYVGKVEPYRFASIGTKVAGTVIHIYKHEGDTFKKGDLLIKIDSSEIRSSIASLKNQENAKLSFLNGLKVKLEAARIALKNAEDEYKREKLLYQRGAAPKVAFEKAENELSMSKANLQGIKSEILSTEENVKAIENQVKSLSSKLKYTNIKAIDNGVVARVLAYEGDLVVPGKPLLKVYYPSYGFRILVNVPPGDAKEIPIGSKVTLNGKVIGKVVKVYPATNTENSLFVAEVKLKGLPSYTKPGELLSIRITGKSYSGKIVPVQSILHMKDGDYVLSVKNGKVRPVKVNVVKEIGYRAIVRTELPIGSKLIVGRESKLLDALRRGNVELEGAAI